MNRFVLFDNHDRLPEKKHNGDAGFDCYLPEDIEIGPYQVKSIDLKIGINLKKDEFAIICMRSSIAQKNLMANTSPIDSGYKGHIHLILHNFNDKKMVFYKNTRICQIVIFKMPKIKANYKVDRNDSGFGSSGK